MATAVPKYFWSVTAGKITQGQGTSSITVNTTGVAAKQLTVTLRLPQFGKDCAESAVVAVRRPGDVIDNPQEPECPQISMTCPPSVAAGKAIFCSVNLSGGTKGAVPRYVWSITSGSITQGQGTSAISVSTANVSEKTLTVGLNLGGFGKKCADRSLIKIDSSPTPPPSPITPTPPPSPTTPTPSVPSPTETSSPVVGGLDTGSPTPSPSAPVEPSPEPGAVRPIPANGSWPWIVLIVFVIGAALAVGALTAMLVYKSLERKRESGGPASTPPGSVGDVRRDTVWKPAGPPIQGYNEVAERHQRLDALIAGAKRKQDDEVTCTVFAPHEAGRGDGFLVQAFAHLPEQAALLQEVAKQADQAATERGSAPLGSIERGQELSFYLQMPGLDVDKPQQSVIWMGEITSANFGVTVPENFKARSINCKLSVSHQNVPIGHVRFNFKISDAPQPVDKEAKPEAHPDFVRYRLAFISYASADRSEVMKRVQMLDLAKVKYFHDLLSLEPGKQWEPLIYRYIDECDVFYLFWSSAAKKSKWVKKEVQRALKRKGDKLEAPPEIMPVPIEGPPPVEPPSYLASIHFDSKFLYFINPRSDA